MNALACTVPTKISLPEDTAQRTSWLRSIYCYCGLNNLKGERRVHHQRAVQKNRFLAVQTMQKARPHSALALLVGTIFGKKENYMSLCLCVKVWESKLANSLPYSLCKHKSCDAGVEIPKCRLIWLQRYRCMYS